MVNQSGKLIYVVGPSGAGKDALLDYARAHLPTEANIRFARRWVTRPAGAGGEAHLPLTQAQFEQKVQQGTFAMHWQAHGNRYGIGTEIRDWLRAGSAVVVSGSREYLPQALADFPDMRVLLVTVNPGVLRERLLRRGRESSAKIEERLYRASQFGVPTHAAVVEIRNDGPLEEGEAAMLHALLGSAV